MSADGNDLKTYEESWNYLKTSRSTFLRLKDDDEFGDPVYLTPGSPRIPQSALDAFLDRRRNGVSPNRKAAK